MIDKRLLLSEFESVELDLTSRGVDKNDLQELKELIVLFKQKKQKLEYMQEFQNKNSKLLGQLKKDHDKFLELKNQLDENKASTLILNQELKELQTKLEDAIFKLPNILDKGTPIGTDEKSNVELEYFLSPRKFDFKPLEHWELPGGWIDSNAGVKLAKSRFSVFRGMGARVLRALVNFMIDINQQNGFELVYAPLIANARMLFGTGQLPKFDHDMFKLQGGEAENSLYLISTSEITLTNLYNDCIIPFDELPILLTSHTPCFRREAGSASKDTRGIIRQHQFDKVELVAIVEPSESRAMQQRMLGVASSILQELNLPHRFVQLCSGDLGFSAANTVDIEVYMPGQGVYREISSVSNTLDFQARRAKIRYRDGLKNSFVHTLNGSSLAVGRTLAALMENHQQEDGSICIPEVLKKYL